MYTIILFMMSVLLLPACAPQSHRAKSRTGELVHASTKSNDSASSLTPYQLITDIQQLQEIQARLSDIPVFFSSQLQSISSSSDMSGAEQLILVYRITQNTVGAVADWYADHMEYAGWHTCKVVPGVYTALVFEKPERQLVMTIFESDNKADRAVVAMLALYQIQYSE